MGQGPTALALLDKRHLKIYSELLGFRSQISYGNVQKGLSH